MTAKQKLDIKNFRKIHITNANSQNLLLGPMFYTKYNFKLLDLVDILNILVRYYPTCS